MRSRRRRAAVWMALAGAAGLLAVVLALRAAGGSGDGGWVLVARAPLPPGLLIDDAVAADALAPASVPADLGLTGLIGSAGEVVGRRTVAPVAAGEPLTQAALGGAPGTGAAPLRPGERAVAVPLSAAAGAGGLAAGARVDVVASSGEGLAGRTRVVVGDAEVIATTEGPAEGELGAAGEALLRVTAVQALRVTAALNFAREVRLLARPRDEAGTAPPAPVGAP
jgi:Flp pilus assembly protein CpaB